MICISLTGTTNEAMRAQMAQAAPLADLLELRLDYIAEPDLRLLLENRPRPVLVTNRAAEEGGRYAGSEGRRLRQLEEAAALGAEYVDVELAAAGSCHPRGAKRIVSFHDFRAVPADLAAIHARIVAAGADVAKLAVMANDITDNLAVFTLLAAARDAGQPTIALAMGERGLISRVLGRKFGGFLTYAALDAAGGSAPGQLPAARLRDEFRYHDIGPRTEVYGVVANPVGHSMSPAIHNAAFAALNRDAVYLPLLVDDFADFFARFRDFDARGYSVTLPHKEAALAAADEADELSRRIGAVNTLYRRGGRFLATNSDCPAATGALEDATGGPGSLAGKVAILLGAGGAARAIAYGLRQKDARVIIVNRTFSRGEALAAAVGAEARRVEDLASLRGDILVNTTSVGMHPKVDDTPAPKQILRAGMVVFDAVYNPAETRLLREAKAADCKVVSGETWFIGQAAIQFELWTGKPAPRQVMTEALRRGLAAR